MRSKRERLDAQSQSVENTRGCGNGFPLSESRADIGLFISQNGTGFYGAGCGVLASDFSALDGPLSRVMTKFTHLIFEEAVHTAQESGKPVTEAAVKQSGLA